MNKIASLLIILSLPSAFIARGQVIESPVAKETNFRNSLWFGTSNTAALAQHKLPVYHDLGISAGLEKGAWRPSQDPTQSTDITARTSGNASVGKIELWGDFAFKNIFDQGQKYNTLMYEVQDDMPYYVLDTVSSPWTRQEYLMRVKAAYPLSKSLAVGVDASYNTKVGAKLRDPRTVTYVSNVNAKPSISLNFAGKHTLGLSGLFDYSFERSEPSNNNYSHDQMVYALRGLGEASLSKVGGNDGISEYYFKSHSYGAGLQYSYNSGVKFILDLNYQTKAVDVEQQVTMPKNMGSTKGTLISAYAKVLWGRNYSNHLSVKAISKSTKGIEKIQHRDDTPQNQRWVTDAENNMSTFDRMQVTAEYDHQFGAGSARGYDFCLGARAAYTSQSDLYLVTSANYNYSTAFAEVFANKQFKLQSSTLLLGANAGYNYSLGATFTPNPAAKHPIAQRVYNDDLAYYGISSPKFGADVSYTIHGGKINYVFDLKASYFTAGRLVSVFYFGIIF